LLRVYGSALHGDFVALTALCSELDEEAYYDALNLYASSQEASRDHRLRSAAYLAFLAERARPDDTIGSVLDRLSEDDLMELRAIAFPEDEEA
jgi:hypothetical protein